MSEQEFRLECLRLACSVADNAWNALEYAEEYYHFVTGQRRKEQPSFDSDRVSAGHSPI